MDKLDRIYQLHKLLKRRKTVVPREELQQRLALSRATLTRLIAFCRDYLHMPIEFDKARKGYCYAELEKDSYELPGLWFNPSELHALLVSQHLLAKVQPGILEPHIAPLRQRIEQLLSHRRAGSKDVLKRIRILPIGNRIPRLEDFQQVSDALVARRQLRLGYASRSTGEISERWVSPQRLVYYRDNWYLDAWCHLREGLRTFSLDHLQVLETGAAALDLQDEQLDAHVARSFGIFAGEPLASAVIHFSHDAARWVADEEWHPAQESRHLEDGRWELVVPYHNPTELIMEILKYGPDAEVISPPELRQQVVERLRLALQGYDTN